MQGVLVFDQQLSVEVQQRYFTHHVHRTFPLDVDAHDSSYSNIACLCFISVVHE
jgi:hypothetical protein